MRLRRPVLSLFSITSSVWVVVDDVRAEGLDELERFQLAHSFLSWTL